VRSALRRARTVVDDLRLPDPWDVRQLCDDVAALRRRHIHLVRRPAIGDSITATVLAARGGDYIFVRDDLNRLHHDHAVCHELGHLLLGHTEGTSVRPLVDLTEDTAAGWTLSRSCAYGDQREREAEAVAELIMDRVNRRIPTHVADPKTERIVRGFGDALR
jgi:hypothetical protein